MGQWSMNGRKCERCLVKELGYCPYNYVCKVSVVKSFCRGDLVRVRIVHGELVKRIGGSDGLSSCRVGKASF